MANLESDCLSDVAGGSTALSHFQILLSPAAFAVSTIRLFDVYDPQAPRPKTQDPSLTARFLWLHKSHFATSHMASPSEIRTSHR